MTDEIKWGDTMEKAIKEAKAGNKPVLLEFFNPDCLGCQQMDKVTFPDAKLINFINENMIALRVPYDMEPLATDFNVKWTPTLVMLDPEGKEHHRTVGFLGPEELLPALLLGIDKMYFDADRFDDAVADLDKIMLDYPKSGSTPEAIYLRGVSLFKKTHDPKQLKEAYEKLQADYPASEWTKRAAPYRLS